MLNTSKQCLVIVSLGYLSWSRNAAICAGVAATVRMFEGGYGPPSTFITGENETGGHVCGVTY